MKCVILFEGDIMEIWKDIKEYEGIYSVSSCGNIYSHISNKTLKPIRSSTGYLHVSLYLNKVPKTFAVHQLVASAFLQSNEHGEEINHIDGNKSNNSVDNLEFVTKSQNQIHAIKHGLRASSPMLGRTGKLNPNSREILQYDISGKYIRSLVGIAEAARNVGGSRNSIYMCLSGKRKTAYGFIWRYKSGNQIEKKIEPPSYISSQGKTWKQVKHREMHKIKQLTIGGNLIRIWDNYLQIKQETKYDVGNIYKVINGKLKTAYGFKWEYESF